MDSATTAPQKESLHQDRLNNSPSKLPSFKFSPKRFRHHIHSSKFTSVSKRVPSVVAVSREDAIKQDEISDKKKIQSSDSKATTSLSSRSITLHKPAISISPPEKTTDESQAARSPSIIPAVSASRQELSHSASQISHGIETNLEPSTALITRRSYTGKETTTTAKINPTAAWLDQQRQHSNSLSSSTIIDAAAHPIRVPRDLNPNTTDEHNKTATSKRAIPPIRSFRSSTAKISTEMNRRIPAYRYGGGGRGEDDTEDDRDRTLRALEGNESANYHNNNVNEYRRQEEQRPAADCDDLFLNLAHDGFTPGITTRTSTSRPEKRRVSHYILLFVCLLCTPIITFTIILPSWGLKIGSNCVLCPDLLGPLVQKSKSN